MRPPHPAPSGGRFYPWASAAPSLPAAPSPAAGLELLRAALDAVRHCPPGTLYRQLCQRLALAAGRRDPFLAAHLLCESLAVTARHQLLSVIHRKIQ